MSAIDMIDRYLDELPTSTWGQSYNLLDVERRRELATKLATVYQESGVAMSLHGVFARLTEPQPYDYPEPMARRTRDMAGKPLWSDGVRSGSMVWDDDNTVWDG